MPLVLQEQNGQPLLLWGLQSRQSKFKEELVEYELP